MKRMKIYGIGKLRSRFFAPLLLGSLPLAIQPAPAWAGEKVLYQGAPGWVLDAPESALSVTSGPTLRVFDEQQRIDHGQLWKYLHYAVKISSPEQLTKSGTLSLGWEPNHGDLIVHAITILRGAQRIDVLAGGAKLTILRREKQLEELQLNGRLTATLQIPDLQVGDILDIRSSVTERDPVLAGHAGAEALLLATPVRLGFGRVRLLWRDDDPQQWKAYLDKVTPLITDHGGWHDLTVTMPIAKQGDAPAMAPGRFAETPLIETSDYGDWQSVSRLMAMLFRTDIPSGAIKPGSDLDHAVAKISAASADPRKRVAAALQLVQEQVRYFFIALNDGSYVPQTPEDTWKKRYGDCKAKTLLLLAILHKMGIDAEPALANLSNGDLVARRLPSVAAFNHVFVLAHLGSDILWLDGTGLGDRLADLDDIRPYHWVLPLRASGAGLLAVPVRAPMRPSVVVTLEKDMRGGIDIAAPLKVIVAFHGALAGALNSSLVDLSDEARADRLRAVIGQVSGGSLLLRPNWVYDSDSATGTINAEGVITNQWPYQDGRYTISTGMVADHYPDRTRKIWQNIPVTMGEASHNKIDVTTLLPRHGAGIVMEGASALHWNQPGNGGGALVASLKDGVWHYIINGSKDGGEFPAAQIPVMRREDSDYAAKAARLRTIPSYPQPWSGIAVAKREHLYDHTIDLMTRYIAEKPDDPERVHLRAWFYASIFEPTKAISDYATLLALKDDKAAFEQKGEIEGSIGDFKAAVTDYQAAFDHDPSDINSMARLTMEQAFVGEKDKALSIIDNALANGDDNAPIYMGMKALILEVAGDAAGGIAIMDEAVSKRPDDAGLLAMRTEFLAQTGGNLLAERASQALKDATHAIQLDHTVTANTLKNRALIYVHLRDSTAAIADASAVLDISPNDGDAYFYRALAEREAGQAGKAKDDIAAARYLFPGIDTYMAHFGLRW